MYHKYHFVLNYKDIFGSKYFFLTFHINFSATLNPVFQTQFVKRQKLYFFNAKVIFALSELQSHSHKVQNYIDSQAK